MKLYLFNFLLALLVNGLNSYKVLVYSPLLWHSHVKFMGSVADTLAEAGFDVVCEILIEIFVLKVSKTDSNILDRIDASVGGEIRK